MASADSGAKMRSVHPLTSLEAARHLLAWWHEAGVDTGHVSLSPPKPAPQPTRQVAPNQIAPARGASSVAPSAALAAAVAAATAATTLDALKVAVETFEGCALKKTARSTVFCDGIVGADTMLIGDAPSSDDDIEGQPFVGKAGRLLDAMLKSIGISRGTNLYLTTIVPWRPPGSRNPTRDELALCRPFVMRHIELAQPKRVLLVGGVTAQTILGVQDSITKLRTARQLSVKAGDEAAPIPVRCLLTPAYLLSRPGEKSLMWQDLLSFIDEL